MIALQTLRLSIFVAAIFIVAGCDREPITWTNPNMTPLAPRLKPVFERTKTVCFGRFMLDVPASTTVVWGETILPLGVTVYPGGAGKVENLAKTFIDELKSERAIYQNDVPLLLSVDFPSQPKGQIVTGYDGFEAINEFKIKGYFRLDDDGFVIDARPMREQKEQTAALVLDIARRVHLRAEDEIPAEPGNCIEHAFVEDNPNSSKDDLLEHVRIGFRLKDFPDAHLSIYIAPSSPKNPEGDSLETQWNRVFAEASGDDEKMLAKSKFFRRGARQIHDWKTGYEVLMRSPDEDGVYSHHDFQTKFIGLARSVFTPYVDVQFQTGVLNNTAGATRASLSDEEAIAVWDAIISTIRVRPTSAGTAKASGIPSQSHFPLGELAATGRTCPQSGIWESSEPSSREGGQRRYIKAGDIMPRVAVRGEPSLWQKIKGETPSHHLATVWKLVGYDDAPAIVDIAASTPPIAQALPETNIATNGVPDNTEGSENEGASPKEKG
ncbi:MAG: T6SS immunity protein Tli4 family protein [Janthinobacterium lividum]